MALFEWGEEYLLGITTIDTQHKKIVDLINKLDQAVKGSRDYTEIEKIIHECLLYAEWHFEVEEELMRVNQYPELLSHHREHENFFETMENFQSKISDARDDHQELLAFAGKLNLFLIKWLCSHIMETDKKYVPFIKKA